MVYSWGRDINQYGILGISKGVHEQLSPSPLYGLIDYSIKSIQLTETKAWAIDSKGKLFLWGSYDTTQNNAWSSIIANNIIIPQPIFVDILSEYFIVKATPFPYYSEDDEIGMNICFKTFTKNYEVRTPLHSKI